jgi:hypothetical protein
MECPKHPGRQMNEVCGEPVCGSCFGEMLLTEPLPRRRPGPEPDLTFGLSGHHVHLNDPDIRRNAPGH